MAVLTRQAQVLFRGCPKFFGPAMAGADLISQWAKLAYAGFNAIGSGAVSLIESPKNTLVAQNVVYRIDPCLVGSVYCT